MEITSLSARFSAAAVGYACTHAPSQHHGCPELVDFRRFTQRANHVSQSIRGLQSVKHMRGLAYRLHDDADCSRRGV